MKVRCPICKQITTWEENPYRPFCSERCKMVDLGRWAMEEYRISTPVEESENGSIPEDSRTEDS